MGNRVNSASVSANATGVDAVASVRKKSASRFSRRLVAVASWLVFSVALAIWWLIFGLQQSERLSELAANATPSVESQMVKEIGRQHRMLMSEGITLVILLLGGGAALLWSIRNDQRRARQVQEFLGAFTHDLKTSLSSLRLQAEALDEDLKDSGQSRIARRLVKDTVRLELQLENSLMLAAPDAESPLLLERVELADVLSRLSHQWPDLAVSIEGESVVSADRRALDSIFKNLAQNSVVHGRSSKVTIDIQRRGPWTHVIFADDGRGFHGDISRLGRMFERHSSTSGSGLGLSLAMKLAKRIGGSVQIIDCSSGFCVEVLLPSSMEEA